MEQRELETTKKDKGFTLVELLIVIVILGILATVTVFAVRGITSRGEASACETDRRTIEVAIEAYQAEHGDMPADEQALVDGGFIRELSSNWNFGEDAEDSLVADPDGKCVGYDD